MVPYARNPTLTLVCPFYVLEEPDIAGGVPICRAAVTHCPSKAGPHVTAREAFARMPRRGHVVGHGPPTLVT